MLKSKFGDALGSIVNDKTGIPNTGSMTQNSPTPSAPAGGITIALDLLPNVQEGDEITLVVQKVDTTKGEIHLVQKSETGAITPAQNVPIG